MERHLQANVVDYYTDVVLPALADRLDVAFPEFGWRRDRRGWVATNEEMTHRVLGVRAERVVAHGPAPRGFLVHGAEPVLWTAYMNGGQVPRGADFVRVVSELAERIGVETAPLERAEPQDRKAELLARFFALAQRELAGELGAAARRYLERRGFPHASILSSGLGVVPPRERIRAELRKESFTAREIESSGLPLIVAGRAESAAPGVTSTEMFGRFGRASSPERPAAPATSISVVRLAPTSRPTDSRRFFGRASAPTSSSSRAS